MSFSYSFFIFFSISTPFASPFASLSLSLPAYQFFSSFSESSFTSVSHFQSVVFSCYLSLSLSLSFLSSIHLPHDSSLPSRHLLVFLFHSYLLFHHSLIFNLWYSVFSLSLSPFSPCFFFPYSPFLSSTSLFSNPVSCFTSSSFFNFPLSHSLHFLFPLFQRFTSPLLFVSHVSPQFLISVRGEVRGERGRRRGGV